MKTKPGSPEQQFKEEPIADLNDDYVDGGEVLLEGEDAISTEVKIEHCTEEDIEADINGIVVEQSEETFLCENIYDSSAITKAFEDEDVFVNEVTIEEVKEDPVEVSQE